MVISKINSGLITNLNTKELNPTDKKKITPDAAVNPKEQIPQTQRSQDEMLVKMLDEVVNSMQVDNTKPLLSSGYKPIQSFEDALKELKFLDTTLFADQASKAQANLKPENVVSLFME